MDVLRLTSANCQNSYECFSKRLLGEQYSTLQYYLGECTNMVNMTSIFTRSMFFLLKLAFSISPVMKSQLKVLPAP